MIDSLINWMYMPGTYNDMAVYLAIATLVGLVWVSFYGDY